MNKPAWREKHIKRGNIDDYGAKLKPNKKLLKLNK